MRHLMHNVRPGFTGVMIALLLVSGCTPSAPPQKPAPTGSPTVVVTEASVQGRLRGTVVALLADNRWIAVRTADGQIVARGSVAATPSQVLSGGHYLAVSPDGQFLYLLAYPMAGNPSRLVVVDGATAVVRASYLVPQPDVVFYALAVGPQTGLLYLFGNRGPSAIITVLDTHTGAVRMSWTAHAADGHTWTVYEGTISPDERHLLVSYAGPDTSGFDVFTRTGSTLQRCQSSQLTPGEGCFFTFRAVAFYGEDILAISGKDSIVQMDLQGVPRHTFDTGLHTDLFEFAVDAHRQRLYTVGACGYTQGFSAVDLSAGAAPPSVLTTSDGVCGERLAVTADGGEIVTGKTSVTLPDPSLPGHLLFVDANSGRVQMSVATPSELLDVLAFPGP
jgi:hypothetical protein